MNPDLSKKVLDKIEVLCGEGCAEVNQLLKKAKDGNRIEELTEFNPSEIEQILHELDKIMSIYDEHD